MRRRRLLATLGVASLGGLAGCTGLLEGESQQEPSLASNRPDAVYMPTHVEGMQMVGTKSAEGYTCALTYTYPHRFWLVTGTRRETVGIQGSDSVHLMPIVWDTDTGIVPPDLNPQVSVSRDGESVTDLSPWPMLSQPMGFHFGDNVQLGGEGTYQVEVRIGSPSTRRTGSLADNDGQTSFAFDFEFRQSTLEEISFRDVPSDTEGTAGAVEPMDMEMLPSTQVPDTESLPGTVRGTARSGDARFVVATLSDATPFGGESGDTYLAVSPRTPHNRYMLPLLSLAGTLTRGGDTVFDGIFQSTIDPELGYHYGAVVSQAQSGDELSILVESPPQTARHEGYETAFLDMPDISLSLA